MKISSINQNNYLNKKANNKSLNSPKASFSGTNGHCGLYLQNDISKAYSKSLSEYFIGCNKISFCANKDKSIKDPVLEFGISLFDKLKANPNLNINEEIKKFLKQNDMEDIEIRDIEEIKKTNTKLRGGFQRNLSESLEYNGGTLFIQNYAPPKDDKACATIASLITHELAHAYSSKTQNGLDVFKKAGLSLSDTLMWIVQNHIEYVKANSRITDFLQVLPLQYAVDNYEKTGIPISEMADFNIDIYRHGTIFPESSAKIDEKTIMDTFSCKNEDDFKKFVGSFFSSIISHLKDANIQEIYKNDNTYELLKNYSVAYLRDEANAYEKNSQINKHRCGLPLDTKTLNDLIPMAYNLAADTLEKIDIKTLDYNS